MKCPECGKSHRTSDGAMKCLIKRQNMAAHVTIATCAGRREPTELEKQFLEELEEMKMYFNTKNWGFL